MVTLRRIAPPRPKGNTTGRIIGGIGPEGSHKPGVPAENVGPAAQERTNILDMLEKVPKPDQKVLAMLAGTLAKDAAWAKEREARTQKLAQTAQKAGLAMPPSAEKAANDVKAIQEQQARTEALQNNPYATTEQERTLAAAPNQGPEGKPTPEQFAAREKVVREFYARNALDQDSASDAMGVGPDLQPNSDPNGYGIDLSTPAYVRTIPPPDQVTQWVDNNHGFPGNFFDPIGGQTPDALGINGDNRTARIFTTPKGEGLITGNGPVLDIWSKGADGKPLPPKRTSGGGTQMTVGKKVKEAMTCATCGGRGKPSIGGTCTCWRT